MGDDININMAGRRQGAAGRSFSADIVSWARQTFFLARQKGFPAARRAKRFWRDSARRSLLGGVRAAEKFCRGPRRPAPAPGAPKRRS
jgi:hypothetical protein